MQKSTQELLKTLQSKQDIRSYLEENQKELLSNSLPQLLEELLQQKQLTKAKVIERANLDRVYAYQIFSGMRSPSRDKLLQLCLGMKTTVEEAQQLLHAAGQAPLYPRDKRDSILLFAFHQQISVIDVNSLLADLEEKLLS